MEIIAIHSGAGYYGKEVEPKVKNCRFAKACSDALKNAFKASKNDNNTIEEKSTLVNAIMELEANPLVNCGIGSNLNADGQVECEASFMSSEKMSFGAVACVSNCKHPVNAAKQLAKIYTLEQSENDLIPSMLLAGEGANQFCASLDIGMVQQNTELITERAQKEFQWATERLKKLKEQDETKIFVNKNETRNFLMDTVGGISFRPHCSLTEACSSSGGMLLKPLGRIGHSALFGGAIWAETRSRLSIAISISGCGEALNRLHFAENLANKTLQWFDFDETERKVTGPDAVDLLPKMQAYFMETLSSPRVSVFHPSRLMLGGLLLIGDGSFTELIVFHNSPHFAFAFSDMNGAIKRYKSVKETDDLEKFCFNTFSL